MGQRALPSVAASHEYNEALLPNIYPYVNNQSVSSLDVVVSCVPMLSILSMLDLLAGIKYPQKYYIGATIGMFVGS